MLTPDGEVVPTVIGLDKIPSSTSVDNGQDFGWLDEILQKHAHYLTQPDKFLGMSDVQAKAAIQAHFTTQAKQHQADLLHARIETIDDALTYHIGQGIDPSDRNWNLMQYYLPRKKDLLQAELDNLGDLK